MKKFLFLLVIFCANTVHAQTVTNPEVVYFTASPDHATLVDHYDLNVMSNTVTGALAFTQGLGKPTPMADNNVISVGIPRFLQLTPGTYVVTVDAVGSGSTPLKATSAPSDPFTVTGVIRAPGKPGVKKSNP